MDSTYGIAYYDCCLYNKQNIEDITKNFIWEYDTYSIPEHFDFRDKDRCIWFGRLGNVIIGGVYRYSRKDILAFINNNKEWFKDFDISLLTKDYYYLVYEDWS